MATYTVWMIEAQNVTVSGGGSLSGITQGDGSHLVGRTITINLPVYRATQIRDNDSFFDDNDTAGAGGQQLDGAQTINGVTYASGTRVEAEYRIVLRDPVSGQTWEALGYNVNNSSPAYATVEGLAFVGPPAGWPPAGLPLTVIAASEGPGSSGQPPIRYDSLVTVPCFTPGARIRTPRGPVRVERLRPDDAVLTRDAGVQPLRLLARTVVDRATLARQPELAPVTIRRGAFGPGRPVRDLVLSPQHRVLVASPRVELLFAAPAVLVAAAHLVNGTTVVRAPVGGPVTYLHLVFDRHHIVEAEGLPVESLLVGPALARAPSGLQAELRALFPDLTHAGQVAVAPCLRRQEARLLA